MRLRCPSINSLGLVCPEIRVFIGFHERSFQDARPDWLAGVLPGFVQKEVDQAMR